MNPGIQALHTLHSKDRRQCDLDMQNSELFHRPLFVCIDRRQGNGDISFFFPGDSVNIDRRSVFIFIAQCRDASLFFKQFVQALDDRNLCIPDLHFFREPESERIEKRSCRIHLILKNAVLQPLFDIQRKRIALFMGMSSQCPISVLIDFFRLDLRKGREEHKLSVTKDCRV